MSETQQQNGDQQQNASSGSGEQQQSAEKPEQTFTQADVDKIVRDRVKRERDKYADYDDLKAKASEATTAEDRIAELEKQYKASEVNRLRSDIAAKYGIGAEDRDLFLTGDDEDSLTAQATRLAARDSESKNRSNVVPGEGATTTPGSDPSRSFIKKLNEQRKG